MVVVLGGCYGDPLPDLAPRGVSDCPELDSCALATGGELVADAFSTTDVRESALVDSVVVTPDGIVEAIDGQTVTDQTVTVRDRDTGHQERIAIGSVSAYLDNAGIG